MTVNICTDTMSKIKARNRCMFVVVIVYKKQKVVGGEARTLDLWMTLVFDQVNLISDMRPTL